jgi:hypothetical protein
VVLDYARHLLSADNQTFLTDFCHSLQPFIRAGLVNSLSQTLIKLTAPGVPDIYQGSEALNFSLVDPDNRREPDYPRLARQLRDADPEVFNREASWRSGQVHQFVTATLLRLRQHKPVLFRRGEYIPLQPDEGVDIQVLNKVPGLDHKHNLQTTKLDLSYSETFNETHLADAYERLLLGIIIGALYLSFAWYAGVAACESYSDRFSRLNGMEFGQIRMWGSLGWAVASSFSGLLFNLSPAYNFIMGSVASVIMLVSTHNLGSVTEFCDYTVMVKGTVLASGPTQSTFTAENLERAFSGVLRHVVLSGSEDRIITDDERPFVMHRREAK